MLLGVDVGGTFTDAVLVDGGRLITAKAPTTPDDQARGVLDAVRAALGDRAASDVTAFAHGMTVVTNALLEGVGARTVLCATEGFVDLVELGRQARPELYRLCADRPAPLVPPQRRVAVPERMGPDGVLRELTRDAADAVAARVAALEPEAVAVILLHAYRHPEHERLLGDALRARLGDDVHVSLSHEVTATFREFERAATTEVDAALSPLLRSYLRRLVAGAREDGLVEPAIMQSSGGLTDVETAADHAALTVLSGPAGGAAAAALLAARLDEPDLLCFDMGGTSCDVCVVESGRVRAKGTHPPSEIGGRPLALPMVDIHTVGAGGGSIAWRDAGGALRVGPRSAGADPGPACYGHGGTEPTVTDANLVLGHLDVQRPLAGGVRLDAAAAERAVGRLADELGLSDARACAEGIVRVANTEMVRALRVVTVQRGIDPRRFALLAFGGAGPLHAAAIADELGIRRIVVPRAAGVLSALGLAAAERRRDVAHSVLLRGRELTDEALASLAGDADEVTWDARYTGQSHELALRDVPPRADALREAFAAAHEERYGYRDDAAEVELVTVRTARVEAGPEVRWEAEDGAPDDVVGPAVVHLPEATLVVADGWRGATDATGTVILERAGS
ncbi:MAG TPA: hydantoinase/oxoprolinase family protein [Baekduia sp.]|nr:hydantoinase/oxoprolinase family protein [Baekduia sp.]